MKHRVEKDRLRLSSLFEAIDPYVIRSFLQEHKTQLMMVRGAGFKLDNIPTDQRRLIALATKIPQGHFQKLLEVLRNTVSTKLPDLHDALETLQITEGMSGGVDPEELRNCRLAVLLNWLSEDRSAEIDAFVSQTDINTDVHINVGDPSGHSVGIGTLEQSQERESFAAEQTTETTKHATAISPQPTLTKEPKSESHEPLAEIDEETDEVIARWKDNHPNFAEVIGVRREGVWYPLPDRAERSRLFPYVGDIYVNSGKHAANGDYGAWKVHRYLSQGQHRTEYQAERECAQVFRVISLHAFPGETDNVREQIRQHGESSSLHRTLFRLADGLTFKMRSGINLSTTDFSEPADAWNSLVPLQAGAFQIALTPLPKPDTTFDLADIDVVARRLLQQLDTIEGLPEFSRARLIELGKWMKQGEDSGALQRQTARVLGRLDDLVLHRDILSSVVDRLLDHPTVRAGLELRLKDKENELVREKSKLTKETESLARQRDTLRKQVESERTKAGEASSRVIKAVRKAFEKALSEGEEKLGESAVFAALLGRSQPQSLAMNARPSDFDGELSVENIASTSDATLAETLAESGLQRRMARALSTVIGIASRVGMSVAFRGAGASIVAENVAVNLSRKRGALVRVYPGLLNPSMLATSVKFDELDAVCVLRANSSAMDAYAEPLERLVWRRVLDKSLATMPAVVMSLIDGPLALPISSSLAWVTLTINLDISIEDIDEGLDWENWEEQVIEKLRSVQLLSPLGARVIQRIARELSKDVEADALTQLKAALVASIVTSSLGALKQ